MIIYAGIGFEKVRNFQEEQPTLCRRDKGETRPTIRVADNSGSQNPESCT